MSRPPHVSFVDSRTIGDAVVTVISEGSFRWAPRFPVPEAEWRQAMPDADVHGRIPIDCLVAHVSLGGASIIIDPGFDDPGSAWSEAFGARWGNFTRTQGLAAALSAAGIRAEDVTHVLITHAHEDHFAGVAVEGEGRLVPRFPRATCAIGGLDWNENPRRGDPTSELEARLGLLERDGLMKTVEGESEVAPGVTMLPTPGETPGHHAVRVRAGGETFYYAGDLFHHACEISHPDWVSPGRDPAVMRASRLHLMADAARDRATVVFSHERFPGWGRIAGTDGVYRWEHAGW
jgi:glyoxylase-like metal-dependent hydrolase (beta-lactamase superfamily II)